MSDQDIMIPVSVHMLGDTVEYTREFALRLQIEAAALAALDSPQAKALAQERLEQAEDVRDMFEHYASL